jgi:hypothetical protein
MFKANLNREPHGLQDVVEVMVIAPEDENYLKRNRIQVTINDKVFGVDLIAKLANGEQISISKGTASMKEAFTMLVTSCMAALNKPAPVH